MADFIEFEFYGFERTERQFKRLVQIEKTFAPSMKNAVDSVLITRIKQELVADPRPVAWRGHVYSGLLYQNTKSKITDEGKSVSFGYFVAHGMHIEPLPGENLIRPHAVLTDNIVMWLRYRFPNRSPSWYFSVGRKLANKIRTKGHQGYPIIHPVFEKNKDKLLAFFKQRVNSELRKIKTAPLGTLPL